MQISVVVEPVDFSCEPASVSEAPEGAEVPSVREAFFRQEILGSGLVGNDPRLSPGEKKLMKLWHKFQMENARKGRVPIRLPEESLDRSTQLPEGLGLWDMMEGWAYQHGVDTDLALLICASATAHASGGGAELLPKSQFGFVNKVIPPTLVADRKDGGFLGAVMSVVSPLREISKNLEVRYESLRRKSYLSNRLERLMRTTGYGRQLISRISFIYSEPDLEPEGTARIVAGGNFTEVSLRQLLRCHHHNAICAAEIEKLPRSRRAKEERESVIRSVISGYGHMKYAIRGFLRFSTEDLDWLFTEGSEIRWTALPVRSQDCKRPAEHVDADQAKNGFDLVYLRTARHILQLRFAEQGFAIGLQDEQAEAHYTRLWESYRKICAVMPHDLLKSGALFELLVWYLLHVSSVSGVRIEPMDIVVRSHEIARRLLYRTAEILDEYDVLRGGRRNSKQVRRVLDRILRLGRPSTLRDLVRGLNKERVSTVREWVDFLVKHRVVHCHEQKYEAAWNARELFDQIPMACFRPELFRRFLVTRIKTLENWQAEQAAVQPESPIQTPP